MVSLNTVIKTFLFHSWELMVSTKAQRILCYAAMSCLTSELVTVQAHQNAIVMSRQQQDVSGKPNYSG